MIFLKDFLKDNVKYDYIFISSIKLSYETDLMGNLWNRTKLFKQECASKEKCDISPSMSFYKPNHNFKGLS